MSLSIHPSIHPVNMESIGHERSSKYIRGVLISPLQIMCTNHKSNLY